MNQTPSVRLFESDNTTGSPRLSGTRDGTEE
jgi:hypothetical protein